ncbi:MAG: hypothetical protein HKN44_06625 [Ilumatobacter sp.]|nr:hypothetical protein [Ilumatobacter sp.]
MLPLARLHHAAPWCDAHHIVHRSRNGATTDENLALFCHRHHQLSHQHGWTVTGTGTRLEVHHPDGTIEVSRPPGSPPQATPPRAGTTGREPQRDGVPEHHHESERDDDTGRNDRAAPWNTHHEQLTLA